MRIAILLPVYNNLEFTSKTLTDLKIALTEHKEFTTIVIDDGSKDSTFEYVTTTFKDVVVLKGNGNLWWSGAVNLGAKYAIETLKADYLLLWNNDITFEEDYFQKVLQNINSRGPNTVIGSKVMIREKPDKIWSMGGYFNPHTGKYYMHGYYQPNSKKYNEIFQVDWLTGMGTIIPKSVIASIGYWDNKNFPQYHGDSDFTYRAKIKGFKLLVVPELIIYNNVKNSGIEHKGNLKLLLKLMSDLRSKSNFSKNLKFYRLHSESLAAYYPLFLTYIKIFGGFFKWKLLRVLGIKKKEILG